MNSETKDCSALFENVASAYRKRNAQLAAVGALLLLLFLYVLLRFPKASFVQVGIVLTFILGAAWGKRAFPRLTCPSCNLETDTEFVRFCPECGSPDVQRKGEGKFFLLWPRCRACGKEISRSVKGHRRLWRIRFCTWCGAFLDARGV